MVDDELTAAVMNAAGREEVGEAIDAVYAEIETRLGEIRPRCAMSGRCCHFEEYGHRLYVTTAELAWFAKRLRLAGGLDECLRQPDGGGCRFQAGKMCQAHAFRPMGCRLFFCDTAKEAELQALYEQMHRRIKDIHERLGVPYCYVEWRRGLAAICG